MEVLESRELELVRDSGAKEEWFSKFTKYIDKLKSQFDITKVMDILARDVAWDMTEGWDDMELSEVEKYFSHPHEFVEALKFGEKNMRAELDIDFKNKEDVCDNSNDYAFEFVEEKFLSLIRSK